MGEMAIGRGTYEPGWIWSAHVGRLLGKERCDVADVGIVISGRATIAMDDGRVIEIQAGDIFVQCERSRQLGRRPGALRVVAPDGRRSQREHRVK
jgi:hypothetical protein